MKKKAIALLLSLTMLSLSTNVYAADTVQNAPTINSSGKVVAKNTNIIIDSKDLTDLASAINNNADILSDAQNNIATNSDEYSSSKTYKHNSLCIKDGSLYQCTSEITTPEAWNSSHWKKVSLSSTINSLNTSINNMQASFQDGCDTIVAGCTTYGSTPASNSPDDIVSAIGSIYTNRYTAGFAGGKNSASAQLVGTYTGNKTISCTSITGYENKTANNFIVEFVSCPYTNIEMSGSRSGKARGRGLGTTLSKSYNASTGTLAISGMQQTIQVDYSADGNKNTTQYFTYKVYVI